MAMFHNIKFVNKKKKKLSCGNAVLTNIQARIDTIATTNKIFKRINSLLVYTPNMAYHSNYQASISSSWYKNYISQSTLTN